MSDEELRRKLNAGPYAGRVPVTDAELADIKAEADRLLAGLLALPQESQPHDVEARIAAAVAAEREACAVAAEMSDPDHFDEHDFWIRSGRREAAACIRSRGGQ